MKFTINWRYGVGTAHDEIDDDTLRELLAELAEDPEDVEHGDVWICDNPSGWSLGAFVGESDADWLVVLENHDGDEQPAHRDGLAREQVLALFRRVADGDVEALRAESWQPGYGS